MMHTFVEEGDRLRVRSLGHNSGAAGTGLERTMWVLERLVDGLTPIREAHVFLKNDEGLPEAMKKLGFDYEP